MQLNYREIVFYNALTTLELFYYILCCEFFMYIGTIMIKNIHMGQAIPLTLWIHFGVVIAALSIGIFMSLHWRKIIKTLQ